MCRFNTFAPNSLRPHFPSVQLWVLPSCLQHLQLCFITCHSPVCPSIVSGQVEKDVIKSEAGVNQASNLGGPANSQYSALNIILHWRGKKDNKEWEMIFFLWGNKRDINNSNASTVLWIFKMLYVLCICELIKKITSVRTSHGNVVCRLILKRWSQILNVYKSWSESRFHLSLLWTSSPQYQEEYLNREMYSYLITITCYLLLILLLLLL